jgi:DNA-damage-inducible protein J
MFLAQSVFNRGLLFEVKIPNDMTLETIKDIKTEENYEDISLEDLSK